MLKKKKKKPDCCSLIKSDKDVEAYKLLLKGSLHSEKKRFNNWDQRLEDDTVSCFTPRN